MNEPYYFLQLLLEWLSWILLFFTWAILTGIYMRRYRLKYKIELLHARRAYYFSMSVGILLFLICLLFIADPLVGYFVSGNIIEPENGPVLFLALAFLFFISVPALASRFVSGISKKKVPSR